MTEQSWTLPEELRQLAETGEAGLVEEVLSVFQSDSAERIGAMRAACAREDRAEIRKQAHALKGSSGQVGAAGLAARCRALELAAATASAAEVAEMVDGISREFDVVSRQIGSGGK